ncbi:MAG: serine protease [Planctomycetia bacterium]|nr:serine protease [Planctomycetia bacterium]
MTHITRNKQNALLSAVTRIIITNKRLRYYGTGTYIHIHSHFFVITCAHIFHNHSPESLQIIFPGHGIFNAKVYALDRKSDLAILSFHEFHFRSHFPESKQVIFENQKQTYSQKIFPFSAYQNFSQKKFHDIFLFTKKIKRFPSCIPLGITTPYVGEKLFYACYGETGKYQLKSGHLLGFCTTEAHSPAETLVVTGNAKMGDSGGPIMNARGELIGVLWGTDMNTVCGTYIGRIQQFIYSALNETTF